MGRENTKLVVTHTAPRICIELHRLQNSSVLSCLQDRLEKGERAGEEEGEEGRRRERGREEIGRKGKGKKREKREKKRKTGRKERKECNMVCL